MSFKPFNFNPNLLDAIDQAKFTKASKIQQLVIPEILKGNDIIASAHSGSGKSASFVLPLIQKLLENTRDTSGPTTQNIDESDNEIEDSACKHGPRVLILTPTRELANQVSACIRRFTRELNLRYGILVGGAPYPPQVRMLKKPIDFLVATPGRLLDHVNNGRVNFNDVEYLVIDELNRILDMNMENDIEFVITQIPKKDGKQLQTLIFSDTLEGDRTKAFSEKFQNNPTVFELAKSKQNYRSLQQCMYIADEGDHKFKLLQAIINSSESKHIIVYAALNDQLEQARAFLEIAIEKATNENNMLKLANTEQQIFFASDSDDKQQDLPATSDVQIIHLDLPDDILVFLQRLEIVIEQKSNQELSLLVGKDEWSMLHQVERYLGKTLSRKKIAGLEPESSEPSISSKLSGSSKNNSQTKNRNPYSGRRQNSNQNPNQKKRHSKNNNSNNSNRSSNGLGKSQGQGNPQGSNKNHNPRNNNRKNKPNRNNQQPLDNGNQIFSETYTDDRDLSWKQYISNISSGNSTPKNSNKKFRRKGGQSSGFDLNNSPMAISAKSMRDINKNDEWVDESASNKKPNVQIRVKGQNKAVGNEQTKNEDDFDKDRIEGKLGIHNK